MKMYCLNMHMYACNLLYNIYIIILFYNIFLFMLYVVFLKIPSNPTPIPTTATLFRGTYFPLISVLF